MADAILDAVDEVKRRIQEHVTVIKAEPAWTEVVRLRQALNALEDVAQLPRTGLTDLFGLGAESGGDSIAAVVKFDDFFGIKPLDAAKRYLRKRTDARPFEEIVAAIKAGGGKVDSEEDLKMGLSRSTLDIVKIGDRYGALENYGHIKRGGKKKASAAASEPEEVEKTEEGEKEEADSEP